MRKTGVLFLLLSNMNFCRTSGEIRCIEGDCRNGYGQKIMQKKNPIEDGSQIAIVYKGEFKDGLRHGKGTLDLRSTEGDFYDGEFAADRYHGYGIWDRSINWPWPEEEIASCPFKYEGQFKAGLPDGEGVLTTRDGKKYSGTFVKGHICYEGNCISGFGANISWTGYHYRGEHKNGETHGKGTEYDPNNRIRYTGEFRDGRYDGFGIAIRYSSPRYLKSGKWQIPKPESQYEGMYVDGHKRGAGKIVFLKTNETLQGIWKDDICYNESGKICKSAPPY